ncbi:hypothetical protein DSO57_1007736 [Entomophthora muscae]|uniref:Uncharacterized protein n=1 Tax=Entomophthora muscae TaxID=34485 RepID=A0ACC2TIA1_9FUNG|nr:hypothetical protein DSO57_1007736 [Entomophthora muscae]
MQGWKKVLIAISVCIAGIQGQAKDSKRTPSKVVSSSRNHPQDLRRSQPPDSRDDPEPGKNKNRCANPYTRPEIRELSREELRDLHEALQVMKEEGSFDRFCRMHLENVPFAHATPYFLPWHREFTYRFEQELRKINPRLTLPYWNWSLDAQAPERSIVLSPAYFGSQGSKCLNDGPFVGWRCKNPNEHCLARDYDGGETLGAFYSPELLSHTLDGRESYDDFRRAIEGPPHGNVHNNIGGDMSTMASCNDPLFYLHHAFVDKLWYDWQSRNRSRVMDFGGPGMKGGHASPDENLVPFNIPISDSLDVDSNYCYNYSSGPPPPTPQHPTIPLSPQPTP